MGGGRLINDFFFFFWSLRAIPGDFPTKENSVVLLSQTTVRALNLNLNHYKSLIFKLNLNLSWIWCLPPDRPKHDLIAIALHLTEKPFGNIRR